MVFLEASAFEIAGLLAVALLAAGSLHLVAMGRRRIRRIAAVADGIRSTLGAYGREEAVEELLSAVTGVVGADEVRIVLAHGSSARSIPLIASISDEGGRPLRPGRLSPAEQRLLDTLRTQPQLLRSGACTAPALAAVMAERGLRRGMAAALRGESKPIGMLLVGRRTGRGFNSDDRDLLALVADHAGVLLENERLERSLREVTSLKEELRHRAEHDNLTGLPNRSLFTTRVAEALEDETAGRIAVLFLDLDDFKVVNDTLGHHAGDDLLVAVARRVSQVIRPIDLAARLGGDEFAVLVNCVQEDDGERVAGRLVAALDAPFAIEGRETVVHASVGIAYARAGIGTADDVLRSADLAMYEAKQSGKRRHARYEPAMQERIRRRHVLVSALERAAVEGEIDVHFQPIVDLETGVVSAFEALARWNRPVVGQVGPEGFIAIADEVGLMSAIGRTVLREACRQTRSWQRLYPGQERLGIAVNLAPSELHDDSLIADVASILEETDLDPSCLTLEITETGVMRRPEVALRAMTALRGLGVSLALDDFGTGHSSLAHLRSFPLDALKIAQPFVEGLGGGGHEPAFVETIVRLAAALQLDVVAEGIETGRQATIATSLACGLGQGYHFGRPVGPLGVTAYLDAGRLPFHGAVLTNAA